MGEMSVASAGQELRTLLGSCIGLAFVMAATTWLVAAKKATSRPS